MPPVVPQSVSSSFFLSFFFCFCRTVDSAKPRFFASVTTDPRTPRRTFAQRRAHDTLLMSSHAAHTAMTGVTGGITTVTTPASLADTQEAIPRLPDPLVVTHILRSEYFDDPADLARLPLGAARCETRWRRRGFGLRSLMKSVPWTLDV